MNSQRTALSDFLSLTRGQTNQTAFQNELEVLVGLDSGGLGAKYISLVETGRLKSLSDEFIRAMEIKTKRSREELLAMHSRPSSSLEKRPDRTIRIVSGHTASAAALIGSALKGLPRVKLATCAEKPRGAPETWAPNGESARWIGWREGDTWPLDDNDFLSQVVSVGGTYYFSAKDALRALDAGWADVVAVPTALVDGRHRTYLRLARLVASDAACIMICKGELAVKMVPDADEDHIRKCWSEEGKFAVYDVSTRDLGGVVRKLLEEGNGGKSSKKAAKSAYRFGAELGTIGDVVANEAVSFSIVNREGHSSPGIVKVPVSSHDAASFAGGSLGELCKGAPEELDGVLMWDPHASWIIEKLREKNPGQPYALISISRTPDPATHRPRRFEFDLVTRLSHTEDEDLLAEVRELLFRIWETSDDLAAYSSQAYMPAVNGLARYFNLGEPGLPVTAERCVRVFCSVAYDVAPKMEAMRFF